MLKWLLSENFLQLWIKNLYAPKNTLHDVSLKVRQALQDLIISHDISADLAFELISMLFGANPQQKLAMRRNQELLGALAGNLGADEVK